MFMMQMLWNKIIKKKEKTKLQLWAREHYSPGKEILNIWHPIIQRECQKMNLEADYITSTCCRANTYVDISSTYMVWRCASCGIITEKITLNKE